MKREKAGRGVPALLLFLVKKFCYKRVDNNAFFCVLFFAPVFQLFVQLGTDLKADGFCFVPIGAG